MKRLTVACVSSDQWGTNYYRGELVKRGLDRRADLGLDVFHTHLLGAVKLADVVYLLRPLPDTAPLEVVHALKRAGKPVVLDWDDDIFNVPSWSMSAFSLDKAFVRDYYARLFECVDLVTTTNQFNASERLPQLTKAPVHVAENALDENQRLLKPQRPVGFDKMPPSIGWAGGGQHNGDLAALDAVWKRCLERGYSLTFLSDIPRSLERVQEYAGRIAQVAAHPDVEMYHQALALSLMDVCVAPLVDHPFNKAKSSLKALEYGAIAGAPCVLSDIEAYADVEESERVEKVDGFHPDDWMGAIERAVEEASKGKKYVLPERFRLGTTTEKWARAFREAHQIVTEE